MSETFRNNAKEKLMKWFLLNLYVYVAGGEWGWGYNKLEIAWKQNKLMTFCFCRFDGRNETVVRYFIPSNGRLVGTAKKIDGLVGQSQFQFEIEFESDGF